MSILLSLILILSVFSIIPFTAHAADRVWYYWRDWYYAEQQVYYGKEYANAQLLQAMDDDIDDLNSGWYYSQGYKEFSDRVTIHGTVNIILTDASYVKFKDGINVSSGTTLNIYGQNPDNLGWLEAVADTNDNAAIGANNQAGDCGNINIYGGGVKADAASEGSDGAGIGSGDDDGVSGINGGTIEINGGSVTAEGGNYGAGIGGGDQGSGGTIDIYGGTVVADAGGESAAIGGGIDGDSGRIHIYDGDVTATSYLSGAGIGAGFRGQYDITIDNGMINAECKGGSGAGIGGGYEGSGGTVTINGGNITATCKAYGAGIGGGRNDGAADIKITGGTINATGGWCASGIGCGIHSSLKKIEITGGDITAAGGPLGTIIIGTGSQSFKFPGGAAIGTDGSTVSTCSYGDIIISGGTIDATGSVGIGGPIPGTNVTGKIKISGGTITAASDSECYGVDSGTDYQAVGHGNYPIEISGGDITMRTPAGQPSMRGKSITLADNTYTFNGMCVKKTDGSIAPKADRVSWCTSSDITELYIVPCEHDIAYTYTDKYHNKKYCSYCACVQNNPHTLGELSWSWADDYSSATATAFCSDCNREITYDAAVTSVEEAQKIIYTASFEENGTTHSDFKTRYKVSVGSRVIGHSISIDGDIGVNFYMELSDEIANSDTAYMRFEIPRTGDPDIKTVYVKDAKKVISGNATYHVFKCQVAAKEMTSQIKGQIIDGDRAGEIYTYSVKEYADYLLEHANENGTDQEKEFANAAELVKKMLNYGAYSQIFFDKNSDNLANANLSADDKKLGDVEINIADPDLSALPEGVTFGGASLSLKSETTLSLYFKSDSTLEFSCDDYTVETKLNGGYQVARIRGIPAARLGDIITLDVNGAQVKYSPLNYCKNVLDDESDDPNLRNVAKAVYRYWNAAFWYFNDNIVDLSELPGDYEAQNGEVLTGTLSGSKKLTVAPGASIMLKDATITPASGFDDTYAGITLLGDATIFIEDNNKVVGGYEEYPGIYVPVDHTLTIDGTGSLEASSNGYACGIGGGYDKTAGNIVINGGTITATGGEYAAGIGGGCNESCGSITINGGTINADGGGLAAGIGGWGADARGSTITINGGTIIAKGGENGAGIGIGSYSASYTSITINGGNVTATGSYWAAGIGCGFCSSCADIIINGGTINAEGGYEAAGIGSSHFKSSCGDIYISRNAGVTVRKGEDAPNYIGAGTYNSTCGAVTIEDGAIIVYN